MSAFTPEWLALRESADLAARNRDVLAACERTFAGKETLAICDLGAGTGASVRAFTGILPRRQHWTLVDHDPVNLAAVHFDNNAAVTVRTALIDFARNSACWPDDTELVTATALLDLASPDWITRFVAAVVEDRICLLATLTFDGEIAIEPLHPLDGAVAVAFRVHQAGDKGFGPAAGPTAARILEQHLKDAGYEIFAGQSPWQVSRASPEFLIRNLEGIAMAVSETGLVPGIDEWLRDRMANARHLTIGHRDIFARPRS